MQTEPITSVDDAKAVVEALNPEFDLKPAEALIRLLMYLTDERVPKLDRRNFAYHVMQLALIRTPAFDEFFSTYISDESPEVESASEN